MASNEPSYPILEFDPDPHGMIEPSASHFGAASRDRPEMPVVGVACFFADVVERVAAQTGARLVTHLVAEHGRHPVWAIQHGGREIAFFQPGLGAPLSALFLEEMIDYGCAILVACGGCGALEPHLGLGHIVVVTGAVRDEGTSYHYLAPTRTVVADGEVVSILEGLLAERALPYNSGLTWTTDAPYRETRDKVARRRAEGCLTVEMEAAALLAVARFRRARIGQILYAGDSLAGEVWDHRGWVRAHDARERLFWLAADAAVRCAERFAAGG